MHTPRCPICRWPLAERVEDGCVLGNCSMRPTPSYSSFTLKIPLHLPSFRSDRESDATDSMAVDPRYADWLGVWLGEAEKWDLLESLSPKRLYRFMRILREQMAAKGYIDASYV